MTITEFNATIALSSGGINGFRGIYTTSGQRYPINQNPPANDLTSVETYSFSKDDVNGLIVLVPRRSFQETPIHITLPYQYIERIQFIPA